MLNQTFANPQYEYDSWPSQCDSNTKETGGSTSIVDIAKSKANWGILRSHTRMPSQDNLC